MTNLKYQIYFERLSYLSQQGVMASIAQFIMSFVGVWLFSNMGESITMISIWFSSIAVILSFRLFFSHKFKQLTQSNQKLPDHIINTLLNQQYVVIFASGLAWSWAVYILMNIEQEPFKHAFQMMSVAFSVGIIGVAVSVLSATPIAFYLFAIPLALLTLTSFIITSEFSFQYVMSIGISVGLLFFISASRQFSKRFDEGVIKTYTIEKRELELINRLAIASEYRDFETGNHINRMSYSCYLLALEAGFDKRQADLIRIASSMHDIGKLGISDDILLKPGKLSDSERHLIETHTSIGANILSESDSEMIQLAKLIAENHHEKVDGTGYPKGLKGYQIPTEAKIAAICDVFDALTSERPYKTAWSNEKALAYIIEQSGSHFDTQLVQKFMKVYPDVMSYAKEHNDISHH